MENENDYSWNGKDLENFSSEEIGEILESNQKEIEYIEAKNSRLKMDLALAEAQVREANERLKAIGSGRRKMSIGFAFLMLLITLGVLTIAGIELVSFYVWLNGG